MSLYTVCRSIASPFVRLFWPTKIVNKDRFDNVGGAVVICNHYAVPDTIIPAVKLYKKELHVLAKVEAFKSKIGNWFLTGIGAIPIRRGEPDIASYKAVMRVLKNDKKFVIYPEGTRNKDGTHDLQEFKRGASLFAIRSEKPILPMMYYKKHKLFTRNYLYIGEPFTLEQFYGQKHNEIMDQAIEYVYQKMCELRNELDAYVLQERGEKYFARNSKHKGDF